MRTFATAVVLFVAACGATAPSVRPDGTVTLGDWCRETTREMCATLARQCFAGLGGVEEGCRDTAVSSCLAGRDAQMSSGRRADELTRCTSTIRAQSCEGLGAGIGSGALATTCAAMARTDR